MREPNINLDKDISTALHHKFDNMPLPNLSPQMIDRVIQRVHTETVSTDEKKQRVPIDLQPVQRHLGIKYSAVGIAASIIVVLATWMMVETQPGDSSREINVVSRTIITTAKEVPSESTKSIIKETKTLAETTLPDYQNQEYAAEALAQQNKDANTSQTHHRPATKYAQTKKKVRPTTIDKNSAKQHHGTASSHLSMKAPTVKQPTTASEPSLPVISSFSQETRDMLCARMDMVALQTAELRKSLD